MPIKVTATGRLTQNAKQDSRCPINITARIKDTESGTYVSKVLLFSIENTAKLPDWWLEGCSQPPAVFTVKNAAKLNFSETAQNIQSCASWSRSRGRPMKTQILRRADDEIMIGNRSEKSWNHLSRRYHGSCLSALVLVTELPRASRKDDRLFSLRCNFI